MNNKKIAFFVGDISARGGTERVTTTLVNALSKTIPVSLTSLENTGKPFFFIDERISKYYVHEYGNKKTLYGRKIGFLSRVFFDSVYIVKSISKIRTLIRKNNIGHMVATDTKMTLLLFLCAIGTGVRVSAVEHFGYNVPRPVIRFIRKILYRYIYGIILLTNEEFEIYKSINVNVETIPNIVAFEAVQPPNIESKRIIAVGRLDYQKGFDLLVKAWELVEKKLQKKDENWHLDIFGEGDDYCKLQNYIESKGLKKIKINPFSNDIKEEYLNSSFIVMSSRYEGLGMVLIEALACGIPCVSFSCPTGPKTIIKDNVNGFLVDERNFIKLSEQILFLIENPDEIFRLSIQAKESIEPYTEGVVVKKWLCYFGINDDKEI